MARIEPAQLALLYRRHHAAVLLYARGLGAGGDAEDLVQDAFVSLGRRVSLPRSPKAWLMRAVRNAATSRWRRWVSRMRHRHRVATAGWFESNHDSLIDAAAAQQALERIAPALREVLILRIWGELTFEQIAEMIGVSTSTAHGRYRKALSAVRKQMVHPCTRAHAANR